MSAAPAPNGDAPTIIPALRRSTRHRTGSLGVDSMPSGSEYHDSEKSMDMHDLPGHEPAEETEVAFAVSSRGRIIPKKSYRESSGEDEDPVNLFNHHPSSVTRTRRHDRGGGGGGGGSGGVGGGDEEDDEEEAPRRYPTRRQRNLGGGFIISDEDGTHPSRHKKPLPSDKNAHSPNKSSKAPSSRSRRAARRNANKTTGNDGAESAAEYVNVSSSGSGDAEMEDAVATSSDGEPEGAGADADGEPELEHEPESDGKPYALRRRAKINYAIPPPLEEMTQPILKNKSTEGGAAKRAWGRTNSRAKGPGWSATGAELGRWMGIAGDDSVRRVFTHFFFLHLNFFFFVRTRIIIQLDHPENRLAQLRVVCMVRWLEACYPVTLPPPPPLPEHHPIWER
jgi:hypothetical protein